MSGKIKLNGRGENKPQIQFAQKDRQQAKKRIPGQFLNCGADCPSSS
jgi:hypothetical protein